MVTRSHVAPFNHSIELEFRTMLIISDNYVFAIHHKIDVLHCNAVLFECLILFFLQMLTSFETFNKSSINSREIFSRDVYRLMDRTLRFYNHINSLM